MSRFDSSQYPAQISWLWAGFSCPIEGVWVAHGCLDVLLDFWAYFGGVPGKQDRLSR